MRRRLVRKARWRGVLARVALLGLLLPYGHGRASAQSGGEEPSGPAGKVDLGLTHLSLDHGRRGWEPLFGFHVSQRIALSSRVRIAPEVSLAVTRIRGMNVKHDSYAFSSLEGGVEGSWRAGERLRLYSHLRAARQTVEVLDNLQVWNYSGSGWTVGAGIEIPCTPGGRGPVFGINRSQGHFDTAERLKATRPIDIRHHALMITLGWGGPLTISPFWR